jgi:hypothetical protein
MRGMAAVHSIAEELAHPRHRGFVPILLQKSLRGRRKAILRNNRIWANECLNQSCEPRADLESMLLARMPKVFLQHYLP